MRHRRSVLTVFLAVWMVSAGPMRGADMSLLAWEGRTMGSPYVVKVVQPAGTSLDLPELQREVEHRLQELNRQMSHYQTDSELSQFNRAPAEAPRKISAEFARVLRFSLELNRRSLGAFDPTLGPIINLWSFGEQKRPQSTPTDVEIETAKRCVGVQHISLSDRDELSKDLPGLALNLGGVAKGFGTDEIISILQRHGLSNVYAAIAGDVRVLGHNARGTKWQVGISLPVAHWRENEPMAAVASLSDQAISTSGDYQQFFTDPQGRRQSHLIDPRTGRPVQNEVRGVSVVATDSITADALGTALFVLGVKEGLTLIESWTNAAALFIVEESNGHFRQIPSRRFARFLEEAPAG